MQLKQLIIFMIGLHNKPQGCGASVVSAAGPLSTKKVVYDIWLRFIRYDDTICRDFVPSVMNRYGALDGMILTGESRGTGREICPSASLSTRSYTWNSLGLSPGLHGKRLATNLLSHGTAQTMVIRCPSELRDFSLLRNVQTASEAHPDPY